MVKEKEKNREEGVRTGNEEKKRRKKNKWNRGRKRRIGKRKRGR